MLSSIKRHHLMQRRFQAMRNVAPLTDKGAGIYEGPGQIQMGGTWQVTVLATKNGQTIAQKQTSVTAEGGMH